MEQQEGNIAASVAEVGAGAAGEGENIVAASGKPASSKPNKWVAVVLALLFPPLGLLNVAQPVAALLYLIVGSNLVRVFSHDDHMSTAVAIVLTLAFRAVAATHAYIVAVQYPEDKPRPGYSRTPVVLGIFAGLLVLFVGLPLMLGTVLRGH